MQQLNRKNAGKSKTLPLKVMQFGGGNFLRAFADWMIEVLNQGTDFKGGIAVIKPTEYGDYSDLKSQEGLFTVVLDGIKNDQFIEEKTLVTAIQKVINCYTDWPEYMELAKSEDLRFIVSNTTEAGIKFNLEDHFEDHPPKEFPAKLTLLLYHRFLHFKGDYSKGCIYLPCELIEDNGEALKTAILKYADHWKLDKAFTNWINEANHFCNTLVDRIVSGYPTDRAVAIQEELGYEDKLLVAGEYYHSWVIQAGEVVQNELPFKETNLNVVFVKDLTLYREMKVRILNGAHTSMVPVGYLAGLRYVKEVMDDSLICGFVQTLLLEEVAPTLDFPVTLKQKFVADVLDRFRNPLLKHQLISISLNSTSKFVTRLLPTLKDFYHEHDKFPKHIVFGLSALILFYRGKFNGKKIGVKDDPNILKYFNINWKKREAGELSLMEFTQLVLENASIWSEDLTKITVLVESVSVNIENIEHIGVKEALTTLG